MSSLIIRLVCGLLFVALVLGVVARPPANFAQGLGMLLPGVFLLNFALRGTRRSRLPRKRTSTSSGAAPPSGSASP